MDSKTAYAPPPVIAPGHTFASVTEKIAAIVLTRRHPLSWFFGFGVGLMLLGMLSMALTWLLLKGTGIWGVNDQDRAIQESMGPIYDRRKEHLGTSDQAIITARRRLLNLARDLQQGIEPFQASHGDIYRVRAMDVNTAVDNFDAVIASHGSGLLAAV